MKSTMLRIIVGGVIVVALFVGSLAAVGASRPRDHEVSRTVVLPMPPAELFPILEDVEAFPCWRSNVDRIEVLGATPLRFVEHGDGEAITYAVEERVAGERLVVRIDDDALPWGGGWTYELVPNQGGTTLTITERGFVDGVVLRGLVTLLMDPSDSITRFQTDLQAHQRC